MKAYVPLPHTIEPDSHTFLETAIKYYVPTQVELLELSQNAAHFTIPTSTTEETYITYYDKTLQRILVYGTKCDCENACKLLNKSIKERALATIQALSKL